MRIIALAGCSAALPTLKYLYSKQYLSAMICPEETTGSDTSSIKSWGDYQEIPCWQIKQVELKKDLFELVTEVNPDLILVYGFPYTVDGSLLNTVRYGGWNVHFSLHQQQEASITIHQLAAGDHYGKVISQCRLGLLSSGLSAIEQLSKISVGLIQEAFDYLKPKHNRI